MCFLFDSFRTPPQLIKCESGAASDKPTEGDDGEEEGGFPPMPDTFLLAEYGDHDKAYARWKATVQWRKDSGANVALATPHPRFAVVKKHYPTFFHGKVMEPQVLCLYSVLITVRVC